MCVVTPLCFGSAELSLCVHYQTPPKLPFWVELYSVKVGKKCAGIEGGVEKCVEERIINIVIC